MVLIVVMEKNAPCNDNDELSFIRLAAVTADVVRFLMEPEETKVDKRREGSPGNDEATKQADQKEGEGLRYLQHHVPSPCSARGE
jgi:hypothetical protein